MVLTRIAAAVLAALAVVATGSPPLRADDATTGDASDAPSFVLTHARVVTPDGPLDDAMIVVRKGRIAAITKHEGGSVPDDLREVVAKGGVVWPAFVHPASRVGLRGDGDGNNNTTAPDGTLDNDLNPWLPANRYAAASGFATLGLIPGQGIVGGRGLAVRAAATEPTAMIRRKDVYLRLDVDTGPRFRSTVGKALGAARAELEAESKFRRDLAEWETAKAKAEAEKKPVPKKPDEPKAAPANAAWRKVLEGEMALLALIDDAAEVRALADALSDERVRGDQLRLFAYVWGDTYQDAAGLADLGATCIVRAGTSTWAGSTDTFCPAVHFLNAGCDVVLAPPGDDRDGLRSYRFELARTLRAGFPADRLLLAATRDAARVLGLGDDTGAVVVGRRADFVLYTGDPLSTTSLVRGVWIDGERIEETP